MQRNIELIEQAYVDHEDFIADFDTVIRAQKAEQLTTKELTMLLTRLRERVFVFLLGPCGPERDAPFTIGG